MNEPRGDRLSIGKVRILPRRSPTRVPLKQRVRSAQIKKGVYLIPSLFTTGNLICGFFSIISTFNEQYLQAAIFIILAHLLDGLDGFVARLTKTTSQFGIEFDSLADLVSFGLAPAILVYYWALVPWGTWGWLAACLYVVCGALRLARFNVQIGSVEKTYFVGLPIPGAGEMVAAIVLMYYFLGGEGATHKQIILLLVIYLLAGLMVSNFRYFSFKQLNVKKRHPFWLLVSAVLFIKLTIAEPQIMFFTVFLLYTLSGPLLWGLTLRKRRRERRGEGAEVIQ
ncbi:MAG: CDP-diacylglycerol--serine O-phosphatidyltransferase [Deltaproteobacteria bacterium]|nr:CDP-diacylglycerol--serine O-phosphatidyltransferase [Deltaproteobacteria bacterium]